MCELWCWGGDLDMEESDRIKFHDNHYSRRTLSPPAMPLACQKAKVLTQPV